MYTRFTYYMSSPARCHVYRVLRQGVGNVIIYRARGEKRRKAGALPFLPLAPEIAPEGKSSCIMQSDIYRGACRRDGTKRAHCPRDAHIFAMVHRSFRPCSRFASCEKRRSPSCRVNRNDSEGRGDSLILMENRSRLCARDPHMSRRRWDVISRARDPTRGKYVRERRGAIVVLMERIACSTV